mgnify:CR=1 FL=1
MVATCYCGNYLATCFTPKKARLCWVHNVLFFFVTRHDPLPSYLYIYTIYIYIYIHIYIHIYTHIAAVLLIMVLYIYTYYLYPTTTMRLFPTPQLQRVFVFCPPEIPAFFISTSGNELNGPSSVAMADLFQPVTR